MNKSTLHIKLYELDLGRTHFSHTWSIQSMIRSKELSFVKALIHIKSTKNKAISLGQIDLLVDNETVDVLMALFDKKNMAYCEESEGKQFINFIKPEPVPGIGVLFSQLKPGFYKYYEEDLPDELRELLGQILDRGYLHDWKKDKNQLFVIEDYIYHPKTVKTISPKSSAIERIEAELYYQKSLFHAFIDLKYSRENALRFLKNYRKLNLQTIFEII